MLTAPPSNPPWNVAFVAPPDNVRSTNTPKLDTVHLLLASVIVPLRNTLVQVLLSWVSMTPVSNVLLLLAAAVGGVRVMFRTMSSWRPSLELFVKGSGALGLVCKADTFQLVQSVQTHFMDVALLVSSGEGLAVQMLWSTDYHMW